MKRGTAPTSAHEPHCRGRIEAKLAEDEKFREKLAIRRQRLDDHVQAPPAQDKAGDAGGRGGGGVTERP
eukprot:15592984-Heterocapsa_arctica.AAC.1